MIDITVCDVRSIQTYIYDCLQLKTWCKEAGDDVDIEFRAKRPKVPATSINDDNPFWKAFRETLVDDL